MRMADQLVDAFERVRDAVHPAVQGLTPEQLAVRLDPQANSIAWLVWHLTRIQDDHVAAAAGTEQVWTVEDWVSRFRLPFGPGSTGYGHGPDDVEAVRATADLLLGYYDATHGRTLAFVGGLAEADLDRVVDESWDPPVTLGVRLVSVVADDLQHVGQAAFVRGVVERS
ncbi:MAG: mycothiol transferase [Acidimicrobiales bacterium]